MHSFGLFFFKNGFKPFPKHPFHSTLGLSTFLESRDHFADKKPLKREEVPVELTWDLFSHLRFK